MIKSGDFINRARFIFQNKFPLYSFLLLYKKKKYNEEIFYSGISNPPRVRRNFYSSRPTTLVNQSN